MDKPLPNRQLVLLGAGHTNAHLLRMWRMEGIPDCGLTCISNYPIATYSGMLPAVLAGQVPRQAMEIDLVRLCAAVGARLIVDNVTGIDRERREVVLEEHPPVPFDVLSIGIGSVPTTEGTRGLDQWATKIKPMQTFIDRLDTRLRQISAARDKAGDHTTHPLRVVVVGGGVAGLEIAFCLPSFLRSRGYDRVTTAMVTRGPRIAEDLIDSARRRIEKELGQRGYALHTNCAVVEVTEREVVCENGKRVPADLVIWAAGAAPPPELSRFDLPKTERGFLETDQTLRVTSGDPIFVVGDTGSIRGADVPKAGVYAVRQGPVLWENVRRTLAAADWNAPDSGAKSSDRIAQNNLPSIRLREYHPQKSFLKLINLGDGSAVGQWHAISFRGKWAMRLKRGIDERFMQKYAPERLRMADSQEMQCRGCGCKLGSKPLTAALAGQGIEQLDDAAEIDATDQQRIFATVDFFTAPFDDAYLSGRIAAIHAASDLLACGARPTKALAVSVVPQGPAVAQQRFLRDSLSGARRQLQAIDAALVGGHTIEGPRAELGFAVIGHARTDRAMLKSNLRPGDQLYLTKPVGIGVLLAAHMRAACQARDYFETIRVMLDSQAHLALQALEIGIEAATDVTGFGLAGHLLEMLDASGVDAELDLSAIAVLPGAEAAVEAGIESTLAPANRSVAHRLLATDSQRRTPRFSLLFDPQTCGGFLFGVPPHLRDSFLHHCQPEAPHMHRIGEVRARELETSRILVRSGQR